MTRHSAERPARAIRASNDRWLFGYADVVTLLFACFASLYAAERVRPADVARDIRLPIESPTAVPRVSGLEQELRQAAARRPGEASLEVAALETGLVLSLAEAGSFAPGRADLTASARQVMRTVAAALQRVPNDVRVEGHTDDTPIQGGPFGSNWELSTARATRVVQFLSGEAGLDPGRLSAAGYAEFRPRVPNDTPEARARNRRVDIVVLGVLPNADEEAR